jgi:Mg2+/Co2+ transporter CorB
VIEELSLHTLIGLLIFLIAVSACFSASETAMMSLNRYRLRHLAKAKHPGAMRAQSLLERPDRLIGLILLGNNFVNILASSITTIIALRLWGEAWIAAAAGVLTLIILIFSEVAPKTLAVLHPERIAFPAAYVLGPLMLVLYPAVWTINFIANHLLKLFGVSPDEGPMQHLSSEELRTVVNEAGTRIPLRHQRMLLSILDMEKVTVDDIMVPRGEIVGIDLDDEWDTIVAILTNSPHTRLPVYHEDINNISGMLDLRRALRQLAGGGITLETILYLLKEPYFIPEGTPLNTQLLNFQRQKQRIGLVVNEYGDILGLVTVEDILEEIVGEFTTNLSSATKEIHPQEDGTYLIDGSANIRELNKLLHWHLPTDGPKTLNGLVIEYLEAIPEPGTSLRIAGYTIEVVQSSDNAVKVAKVRPAATNKEERTTG